MPRKEDSSKQSQNGTQADVPRDFIKCYSSPPFKVVFWEPSVPREKFSRGGRPPKTKAERNRLMAEEFLERTGKGKLHDTPLMAKIGQDIRLMKKINGGKTIGRNASIEAVKDGCAAIVRDLATSEVRDVVSSGALSVVKAAKLTYAKKPSGK
jgi:hypothetical protein